MNSARLTHEICGLKNCLVDGFKHRIAAPYSSRSYFLTHYHSDHYGGLSSGWNHGIIYCSPTTANLICDVMEVNSNHVKIVDIGESVHIDGARVTFLDANHCPGAAMLLFELDSGLTHLHTGDMRYIPAMLKYPQLARPGGVSIDKLYLDTTYAHPKHKFMPQSESIQKIVGMTTEFLAQHPTNGIIYVSAYNLGKERIIFALADALPQFPIFLDGRKMHIMDQLLGPGGGKERVAAGCFTSDPYRSSIHVCRMGFVGSVFPYFKPNFAEIQRHMRTLNEFNSACNDSTITSSVSSSSRSGATCAGSSGSVSERRSTHQSNIYTEALAFIPTGWADSSNYNKANARLCSDDDPDCGGAGEPRLRVAVQLVPYSEHSQCEELREFVAHLRPREVVPTVFDNESHRLSILDLFRNLVDRKANLQRFIARMAASPPPPSQAASSSSSSSASLAVLVSPGTSGGTIATDSSSSGSGSGSGRKVARTGSQQHSPVRKKVEVVSLIDDDDENDDGDGDEELQAPGEALLVEDSHCSRLSAKKKEGGCSSATTAAAGVESMWCCKACTYRHESAESQLFLVCVLCATPRVK